jgi:hypothetical protein
MRKVTMARDDRKTRCAVLGTTLEDTENNMSAASLMP